MIAAQSISGGIVVIKFCESLNALKESEFTFSGDETEKKNNKKDARLQNSLSSSILFMLKTDTISCPVNTTAPDAIRTVLKQNNTIAKMWHITILYVCNNFTFY